LEEAESIFKKAGFHTSDRCCSRPSCFDFAAKKENLLTFIKVHVNIGSASQKDASELVTITEHFNASPLFIGEKTRNRPLENDTVYSRYDIYAVNTKTLRDVILKELYPLVEAGPGGYYVQINGQLIRERRQKLGLSIGKLAEMIGVSRRTLYGYEKEMAKASVSTAYNLEWALGVPVVEPIDIFKPPTKRKSFLATARRIISRHCFLYKIFKKFKQFNFKFTQVKKAPFDFIAKLPGKDVKIIGGVALKKEAKMEKRAEEIVSISKITGAQPIFITTDGKSLDNEIPSFNHKELERMMKPEELLTVL
jgi:putative transcriptional regulator